jgi:hypothetical protein
LGVTLSPEIVAQLVQQLPIWAPLFEQVSAALGEAEEVGRVVYYLLRVGDTSSQTVAVGMLRSVLGSQRAEELMGSWGEELLPLSGGLTAP